MPPEQQVCPAPHVVAYGPCPQLPVAGNPVVAVVVDVAVVFDVAVVLADVAVATGSLAERAAPQHPSADRAVEDQSAKASRNRRVMEEERPRARDLTPREVATGGRAAPAWHR